MEVLSFFFDNYLPQLPFALIWILGIVLAIYYRRRYPQVSLAAGAAFLVFLMLSILNTALYLWRLREGPGEDFLTSNAVASMLRPLVTMAAWLLLLRAVFGWRTSKAAPGPTALEKELPIKGSNSREVAVAALVGAVAGGSFLTGLRYAAPFFLDLCGTTATMVLLGVGWGAAAGAVLAVTKGMLRGAIAGALAGVAVVLIWATVQGPLVAGWILYTCPPYGLGIGALLGTGLVRGWQALIRQHTA